MATNELRTVRGLECGNAWYTDEYNRHLDMRPGTGINAVVTGHVIEGPTSQVDEDSDYRCDSFVLRVHASLLTHREKGGDNGIEIHVDSHKDSAPPLWLSRMHVGALVQAEVWMDFAQFFGPGGTQARSAGGAALAVRVYDDED